MFVILHYNMEQVVLPVCSYSFINVAYMEYACVPVFNPSLLYLPL